MPKPLSTRTASFTDSVIRRMTRISMQYDAVNLSQGFPDLTRRRRLWPVWQKWPMRVLTSMP